MAEYSFVQNRATGGPERLVTRRIWDRSPHTATCGAGYLTRGDAENSIGIQAAPKWSSRASGIATRYSLSGIGSGPRSTALSAQRLKIQPANCRVKSALNSIAGRRRRWSTGFSPSRMILRSSWRDSMKRNSSQH